VFTRYSICAHNAALSSALTKRIGPLTDQVEEVFYGVIIVILPHKDTVFVREQSL
jgi:hypothetical protein